MSLVHKIKEKLSGGVSVLMAGTLLSQLIPFLISPILTRIFTPQEFGAFGLYFSITMIFSVFITGRYEMAIMLPKDDRDSMSLVGLSLCITFSVSAILFVIVLFFGHEIAVLLKSSLIERWLLLLPVTMIAIGTYQTFNYWNNRKGNYTRLSVSRVARSANTSGSSVLLGHSFLKSGGLILADSIGQVISSAFLFVRTWKEDKLLIKQIEKNGMKEQAIRYQQFPKINVLSGLIEKTSGQSPVFMISSFFGEAVSGFFSFSQRIIGAPASIISRAVGDVFRQKANLEYQENGHCEAVFIKTLKQLSLLGVALFTIFFAFAPQIFAVVFGEKWIVAGEYAQLMTPMFFLQFIVSPLSNMFLIAEKQKLDLYLQVFLLVGVLSAFLCGYNIFKEPKMCIILFTFVYSSKYIFELYLSYQFSKGKK